MKLATQLRKGLYKLPEKKEPAKPLVGKELQNYQFERAKASFFRQLNQQLESKCKYLRESDYLDFEFEPKEAFTIKDEYRNWSLELIPFSYFEPFLQWLKEEKFKVEKVHRQDDSNAEPLEFSKNYYLRVSWK